LSAQFAAALLLALFAALPVGELQFLLAGPELPPPLVPFGATPDPLAPPVPPVDWANAAGVQSAAVAAIVAAAIK